MLKCRVHCLPSTHFIAVHSFMLLRVPLESEAGAWWQKLLMILAVNIKKRKKEKKEKQCISIWKMRSSTAGYESSIAPNCLSLSLSSNERTGKEQLYFSEVPSRTDSYGVIRQRNESHCKEETTQLHIDARHMTAAPNGLVLPLPAL